MVFKFDSAYRETEEYKEFMDAIKKENPWMPQALAEACIIAHKNDPSAYKKDKDHKKVLSQTVKPPENKGEIVVNNVQVQDLTHDILKQRADFYEKHGITEDAELIPKPLATIEEVEA